MKTVIILIYNHSVTLSFNLSFKENTYISLDKLFKETKKEIYRNIFIDCADNNDVKIYVKDISMFQQLSTWIITHLNNL